MRQLTLQVVKPGTRAHERMVLATVLAALGTFPCAGWQPPGQPVCGTPHSAQETLFLRGQRLLREPGLERLVEEGTTPVDRIGQIAIIQATPEIVSKPNPFDLAGMRIAITPAPTGITVEVGSSDSAQPVFGRGFPLPLDDDDFATIELPFAFPFFGEEYRQMFVNSDGNLSFSYPEFSSTARDYSRLVGGPPRIAPFFRDLDPSKAGTVRAESLGDRLTVAWDGVPVYTDSGIGKRQTFAVTLFSSGGIEFVYGMVPEPDAVVGIFPGVAATQAQAVDWSAIRQTTVSGSPTLAEVFRSDVALDEFGLIQSFYRKFEDAYDQLIFFDELDFDTGPFSLAHAWPVRNEVTGIGEYPIDYGDYFGSARRLSGVVNMQSISQYPPNPLVPIGGLDGASLLTVLAHEVGHRYLAYPAFTDPETGERSTELLGRQLAHWSFFFDSGASVLEGNRIKDHGPSADGGRFETIAVTQTFSPLDQYLMGLRDASEVGPLFFVRDPVGRVRLGSPARSPEVGVRFDGVRKDLRVEDIVEALGERRPQASVSQRHFRFAFVLLVPDGQAPTDTTLRLLERLRSIWHTFVELHLEGRATMSTELVRMLHLSTWPAGGVLSSDSGMARVSIARPRETDLTVHLDVQPALAGVPATVTIPAGSDGAEFSLEGLAEGVANLTASAMEDGYDTAVTRLRIRPDLEGLSLQLESLGSRSGVGGGALERPATFRVVDEDHVRYGGVEVEFVRTVGEETTVLGAGTTDPTGVATFEGRLAEIPGPQSVGVRLRDAPGVSVAVDVVASLHAPEFEVAGVVNAASGIGICPPVTEDATPEEDTASEPEPPPLCSGRGFAPGSLITLRGRGLATRSSEADTLLSFSNPQLPQRLGGAIVYVAGIAASLVSVSPEEITLQLPFGLPGTETQVTVVAGDLRSETVALPIAPAQPGIFADQVGGTSRTGFTFGSRLGQIVPARAGGLLQLSATGLGEVDPIGKSGRPGTGFPVQKVLAPVKAWMDGQEVPVALARLSVFTAGRYVVVLELPEDLQPGQHTVMLSVDGVESNTVGFQSE